MASLLLGASKLLLDSYIVYYQLTYSVTADVLTWSSRSDNLFACTNFSIIWKVCQWEG